MSSPETWCVPVSDYESPTSLSSIGTTVVSVSFLLHCVVLGMLVHMWRSMGVKVLDSLSVRRLGARSIGLRASAASAAAPAQPAEPADALPQRLSKDSVQFASLRMTGTAFDMAVVLGCVMLHVFAAMQYPSVTTASCRTRPFFLVAGVALIMGASLLRLFWIDSLDARGYSKPGLSWSVSRPEPDSARTAPSDGSHRSGPPSLVQSSSANGSEFWSGFKVVEAFKWYNRHERRLVKHLGLGTLAALVVPALWATMDGMVTEPVTVLRAGGEEAVRYEQCVSRSATWLGILTFAMLVGGVVLTIKAYKLLRNPAPVNTSLRMLVTLLLTLVVAVAAVSQRAYFDGQPDGKFMGFVIFACAVCWVITGSLAVSRLIRFYLPHSSVGRALEAAYFPSVRQQQREFFFMQLMRGQNALRRRGAAMRQAASAFDDLNESMGAAQPVGASGINIHMLSPSPYTDSQALAELRALALLRDENEMLREKITQLEMTVVELVPGSVSISIDTSGTSSSPAAAGELVPPAGEQQRNSDSLSSLEEEPPYRTDSAGSISSMFGRHGSFERSRSISASSAAYSTLPLAATGSSKMPSSKPVFVRAKSAPAPGAHVSGFVATPAAGPRSPSSGARDRDRIQRTATPILPSPDATVRRLSHRRSLSSRRNSRNLHEQQIAAKDDQIARLQRQLRDLQRGDEDERPSDSSGSSGPTRWGQPQG